MTDNEIVLEYGYCHINNCNECPRYEQCLSDFANGKCPPKGIRREILDLINRQKAEIERLKPIYNSFEAELECAKSEAIKEFAERLKVSVTYIPWCEYPPVHECIDNLVKEMTGKDDVKSGNTEKDN